MATYKAPSYELVANSQSLCLNDIKDKHSL